MHKIRSTRAGIIAAALSCAVAQHALAGWIAGPKLTTFPSVVLGERFGFCNATNGAFLAVGAPDAIVQANNGAGAVYIFKRVDNTWVSHQKLILPAGAPRAFAQFGSAVAMSRDTLVIGAWGHQGPEGEAFAGCALVYTYNSETDLWVFRQRLFALDAAAIDQFGWSVSVDMPESGAGVIAVGKILDGPQNRGAVCVFEGSGAEWSQVAKLVPADLGVGDQFGTAVSVRGDLLVAATQKQNNNGANAGAAYVFTRTAAVWGFATKLLPGDIEGGDAFGASVSAGDGIIVVGSPGRRSGSVVGVGLAYIFEGSGATWAATTVQQRDPFQNDAFGYSVAVNRPDDPGPDPVVIVGAPGYDSGQANNGAAFAYRKVGAAWVLDATDLFVPTAAINGALGRSVSVSPDGSRSVLSSESPSGSSGAAYGFTFLDKGGGSSPGAGGTPGDTGGTIPGGGVPPTGTDGGPGGPGGGGPGAGTPGTSTPLPPLQADFGTVIGSIVVVNPITRTVMVMQTDGKHENHKPRFDIVTTYPEGYELVACPDLNGDGGGDLLFHERSTSLLHGWLRDGLTIINEIEIGELPDGFSFHCFGSFNGDAIDDLLLRNPSNGHLKLWIMSASGSLFSEIDVVMPDNHWMPMQVDLTGDGRPDLVVRQPGSGEFVSLNVSLDGRVTVIPWPDAASDYLLCAGADVNGDGAIDIIWKNESQGQYELWLLDGNRVELRRLRLMLDADTWRIEKVLDFDGNGAVDFILSRNGTGRLVVVYMEQTDHGPKIIKSRRFATIDSEMEIIDFATR